VSFGMQVNGKSLLKIDERSGLTIHYSPSNRGNRQTVWRFAIKIRKFAA
jgi:hypothetical protein